MGHTREALSFPRPVSSSGKLEIRTVPASRSHDVVVSEEPLVCCECGMGWQSRLGTSEGSGGNRRRSTVYSWRPCEEVARPEARAASSVHTMQALQAGTLLSRGCSVCVCACVCAWSVMHLGGEGWGGHGDKVPSRWKALDPEVGRWSLVSGRGTASRVSGAEVRPSRVGGPTSLGPGCAVGCLAGPRFSLMLGGPG